MKTPAPENTSIAAGALAALGASTCCVLPLAAVAVGLGGAWISQLRALEQYFFLFLALAIAAFGYAFYRLYLRPAPCSAEEACRVQAQRRGQRIAFWSTLISAKLLVLAPFAFGWVAT